MNSREEQWVVCKSCRRNRVKIEAGEDRASCPCGATVERVIEEK